ncbi:MAG: PKD domain-containing protein [Anaerolineae bacterium]
MALVLLLLLVVAWSLAGSVADRSASARAPLAEPGCEPVTGTALSYSPTLAYAGDPVQVTNEILTGSLPVTYTWDYGDSTPPLTGTTSSPVHTATHTYTTPGTYPLTLAAWNACTTPPLTTTTPITVVGRPCVTVTALALTYTPTQPYTYTTVHFAGQVLTGSLPVTYSWAFGDGTLPITGTSGGPQLATSHTFTVVGPYTTALSVWNRCTLTPAVQTVPLTVAHCASLADVSLSYRPSHPHMQEPVTFTAQVSGSVPASSYRWDFGDGITATGAVATHVYTTPATYTVSLTAANPCSQQTASASLFVAPPVRALLPWIYQTFQPPHQDHLGYGANIASADHVISLTVMGFDWAKGWVDWEAAGPGPNYNWIQVDNQLAHFVPFLSNVLLRLHGNGQRPPVSASDLAAFEDVAQALATYVSNTWRARGLATVAYEIWNEPNLDYEWGGAPNAAQYTALLQAAYRGIKAGDPRAIVVSAGLATTGGTRASLAWAQQFYDAIEVAPDLTFLRNMYNHGAKGYFDALGSHPYGGSYPPETAPDQVTIPIYFRRAEEQHQVMLDHGDTSPVWATEVGWILRTDDCYLGEHEWMEVSEALQAQYLTGAYAYADEHWPWMGPMFLFNLDFATVDWYQTCDPMRWYSITYRDNPHDPGNSPIRPRQAFYTLCDMPKHSAW